MKAMLPRLTEKLRAFHSVSSKINVPDFIKKVPGEPSHDITHLWFWPRLSFFFQNQDVIVTETGTANFGILEVPLPASATLVSQVLWGSIGWSVGSCLGAALAAKELGRPRTILFVGDGSLYVLFDHLYRFVLLLTDVLLFSVS